MPPNSSGSSTNQRTELERPTVSGSADLTFHLARGAALLHEGEVQEAKDEIQQALSAQPSDPEGQALLAAVYFRLGLYPRAISLYERLVESFPGQAALKVNLGLCFLKTGQHVRARHVLESVTQQLPAHRRAWGYLGLAYERLGDSARARVALQHAGRSVKGSADDASEPVSVEESAGMSEPQQHTLRAVAEAAFEELEAQSERSLFSLALPSAEDGVLPGPWLQTNRPSLLGQSGPAEKVPPHDRGLDASLLSGSSASQTQDSAERAHVRGRTSTQNPQSIRGHNEVASDSRWLQLDEPGPVVLQLDKVAGFELDGESFRRASWPESDNGRAEPESDYGICRLTGLRSLSFACDENHVFAFRDDNAQTWMDLDVLVAVSEQAHAQLEHRPGALGNRRGWLRVGREGLALWSFPRNYRQVPLGEGSAIVVRARFVLGWSGQIHVDDYPMDEIEPFWDPWVRFQGVGKVYLNTGTPSLAG